MTITGTQLIEACEALTDLLRTRLQQESLSPFPFPHWIVCNQSILHGDTFDQQTSISMKIRVGDYSTTFEAGAGGLIEPGFQQVMVELYVLQYLRVTGSTKEVC